MKEVNEKDVMKKVQDHINGLIGLMDDLEVPSMMLKLLTSEGEVRVAFILTRDPGEAKTTGMLIDALLHEAKEEGCEQSVVMGRVFKNGEEMEFDVSSGEGNGFVN